MRIYSTLLMAIAFSNPSLAQSNYLLDVNTLPTVNEKNEEFKFYMELNTNQFDSIVIMTPPLGGAGIKLDGSTISQFTLYDNGQNGDLVASDGIYTRGGFSYLGFGSGNSQIMYRFANVHYYEQGTSVSENLDLVTSIVAYDASLIPVPQVIQVNDTIQYSDYTINVVRPAKWGDNPFPPNSYWLNTLLFDDFFCDGFFILVQNTTNNMPIGTGSGATFGPSSNFTQGIGKTVYDAGYPFVGLMTVHWTRSFHAYTVHEFLHKWAATQDLYGSTASGQGITGFGHWAWIQMNTSGLKGPTSNEFLHYNVIGGDTLEVFRNYNNGGVPYWSNLEFYMAGLMPIDSVPFPITYLTDVNLISSIIANPVVMTATVNTVTEAEWLSVVGPRVPAIGPDKYKIAQVVFSDELLTPGQMSFFDESMRRAIQKNNTADFTLYEATQGLLEIEPYLIPNHRLVSDLVITQDTTFLAKSSIELDSVVIQAPYSVIIQSPEAQIGHFECQPGAILEAISQSGCDQN